MRKIAAVAADFVNPYFWGARRCPGRHAYYGRAGARPGELGGGDRKESDDDLCHPWPRRSFLWRQYGSGAISRRPVCRAPGNRSRTVLARFPGARFVARPEVIKIMRQQASPESLATFWNPRFPGQISSQLAIAEELAGNVINLEGHDLVSVPLGFTDTASTTCLHVPSIGLIVAGDAAYNCDHLHLSESPDQQRRHEWIAALDKMESLKPRAVIAGHKRVGNDDSPRIIGETRKYIRDFERLAMHTTTARELYDEMLKLYPDWINRGALWSSVRAIRA